jgi:hypothetical protein
VTQEEEVTRDESMEMPDGVFTQPATLQLN